MDKMKLSCIWTVKERDPKTGLFVVVRQVRNLFTNYGLNALAGAVQGGYVAPNYLIIDTSHTTFANSPLAGAMSFQSTARLDQTGDTQLILAPDTAFQETVTFSTAPTGTGPYTYTVTTPLIFGHTAGDIILRQVSANDTLTNVVSEAQYDTVNDPGNRAQSVAGYNSGVTGNWTMQFYFTGIQANVYFGLLGLSDARAVGTGNLHNHFVLGYDHSTVGGNDVEIDGSLTLSNA